MPPRPTRPPVGARLRHDAADRAPGFATLLLGTCTPLASCVTFGFRIAAGDRYCENSRRGFWVRSGFPNLHHTIDSGARVARLAGIATVRFRRGGGGLPCVCGSSP